MSDDDGFHRMVDAAIGAHRLLTSYGTPTMELLSRLLLMEIGRAVAQRSEVDAADNDNPIEPDA